MCIRDSLYRDQILNVYDLLVLIEYAVFNSVIPVDLLPVADMNSDGSVDIDDIGPLITLIMGY